MFFLFEVTNSDVHITFPYEVALVVATRERPPRSFPRRRVQLSTRARRTEGDRLRSHSQASRHVARGGEEDPSVPPSREACCSLGFSPPRSCWNPSTRRRRCRVILPPARRRHCRDGRSLLQPAGKWTLILFAPQSSDWGFAISGHRFNVGIVRLDVPHSGNNLSIYGSNISSDLNICGLLGMPATVSFFTVLYLRLWGLVVVNVASFSAHLCLFLISLDACCIF
jgi:hypothetical protein